MRKYVKKKIRTWEESQNTVVAKKIAETVETLYLIYIFRIRIIQTKLYLAKLGIHKSDLPVKLQSSHAINFPKFGSHFMNPSIVYDGAKFQGAARISNGGISQFCDYAGRPIQEYRKRSELLLNGIIVFQLNLMGEVSGLKVIRELSTIPNFEDPRIFIYRNQKFLVMTNIVSPLGQEKEPWSCTVMLENLESGKSYQLASPTARKIEKNWVPIQNDQNLQLLYSSNPIAVIDFDIAQERYNLTTTDNFSHLPLNNRTQVIKTPHPLIPYLRIASRKFANSKVGYTPFHYFEILSVTYKPIRISKPFVFKCIQMEMCQGLTLDGEQVVLTWTEKDIDNYIGTIKLEAIIDFFDN
jgi:hypothetical protein